MLPIMTSIPFIKMHGAGNDFVIIDGRIHPIALENHTVIALADRHKGVGCDQLVVIEASSSADCFMRIYNADGSRSATCGNATRCVADILFATNNAKQVTIDTLAGILTAEKATGNHITVNMGKARLNWQEIPLAEAQDTLLLPIASGPLSQPVAVSMGNPHAVFFVEDTAAIALETHGPLLEHHPLFPERANIGVAQIISRTEMRLRVWERGAGETLACGSGACAAAVAACRRGLTDNKVAVHLPGGSLLIEWLASGEVLMTGEAVTSFRGEFEISS